VKSSLGLVTLALTLSVNPAGAAPAARILPGPQPDGFTLLHNQRLIRPAGVQVELHLFPGTFHGSALVRHAAVTKREQSERLTVVRRALGLDS